MTCETVQPELDSFARNELEPSVAKGVRAHLASCDACTDALAAITQLGAALAKLPTERVDADALADRVLAQARRAGSGRRSGERGALSSSPSSFSGSSPRALVLMVLLGVSAGFVGVHLLRDREAPVTSPSSSPGEGTTPEPNASKSPPREPTPSPETPAPESPAPVASPASPTPTMSPLEATPTPSTSPSGSPLTSGPTTPDASPTPETAPTPDVIAHNPASPTPAPAASATPNSPAGFAFAVASFKGEAHHRNMHARSSDWQPIRGTPRFDAGDELRAAPTGSLEVALIRGETPREAAGATSERFVLGAGARATLAPQGDSAFRLDAGEVFASSTASLTFLVGRSQVSTAAGDVGVSLARDGGLEVTSYAGRAQVQMDGSLVDLAPGEKIVVERNGRAGRVTSGAGEGPKWLAPSRAIEAAKLVWGFRARDAEDPLAPPLLVGTRGTDAAHAGEVPKKGPGTRAVCFGRGTAEGIAPMEAGLRLRVRYRLATAAPLGIQLTDATHGRNYQAVIAAPRVGAWTEVEVSVDALVEETKAGHTLAPGDVLDLVTVSCHGNDPAALGLDVAEVTLFRGR